MKKNHLVNETSLYLLQHVANPVDWYPWGAEALEKAKKENKPIFLSIGYSACHWCHVMAHESFEDEETAKLMNKLFVNIKVDREERPDLDKIYQTAYQLLMGNGGGWPLSVFLTPEDQVPFIMGTYFPKEPHYQMPAFAEVLKYASEVYHQKKNLVIEQNNSLLSALKKVNSPGGLQKEELNFEPIKEGNSQLVSNYDHVNGGFGNAPKFPYPTYLNRLLEESIEKKEYVKIFSHTLVKMAYGGIYDQVGGGFFRYSTDAKWQIPHFEKMLYDNGQLLGIYANAYAITHQAEFADVIEKTGGWVIREMQSPEGGYFSSLDADSEGEEGKYYVWGKQELHNFLTTYEYKFFEENLNGGDEENFEGKYHLFFVKDREKEKFHSIQKKLLQERMKRVLPGRDEKILTSWNALMIKGMALAGMRLQKIDFIASAQRALDFIHLHLWQDGELFATYQVNQSRLNAYLDDYAFLIDAILSLLEVSWNFNYLQFAKDLADTMLNKFFDKNSGAFFFTSHDHESLIYRPINFSDEATPSGNAIAVRVLIRLGYLLGDREYLDAAEKTLQAAWADIKAYPRTHCAFLSALSEYLAPPEIIIVRGEAVEFEKWQKQESLNYNPHRLTFFIPDQERYLPVSLKEKHYPGYLVAYQCKGYHCLLATTELHNVFKAR